MLPGLQQNGVWDMAEAMNSAAAAAAAFSAAAGTSVASSSIPLAFTNPTVAAAAAAAAAAGISGRHVVANAANAATAADLPSYALRHIPQSRGGGGLFFLKNSERRDVSTLGRGGGFFERQGVSDRVEWDSDQEEVDEFGRKKKRRKIAAPKERAVEVAAPPPLKAGSKAKEPKLPKGCAQVNAQCEDSAPGSKAEPKEELVAEPPVDTSTFALPQPAAICEAPQAPAVREVVPHEAPVSWEALQAVPRWEAPPNQMRAAAGWTFSSPSAMQSGRTCSFGASSPSMAPAPCAPCAQRLLRPQGTSVAVGPSWGPACWAAWCGGGCNSGCGSCWESDCSDWWGDSWSDLPQGRSCGCGAYWGSGSCGPGAGAGSRHGGLPYSEGGW